jgi:hypothetical protein
VPIRRRRFVIMVPSSRFFVLTRSAVDHISRCAVLPGELTDTLYCCGNSEPHTHLMRSNLQRCGTLVRPHLEILRDRRSHARGDCFACSRQWNAASVRAVHVSPAGRGCRRDIADAIQRSASLKKHEISGAMRIGRQHARSDANEEHLSYDTRQEKQPLFRIANLCDIRYICIDIA